MHKKISSLSLYGSVFLALGILTMACPAQAGFQWIAPESQADQAPSAPVSAAPLSSAPVSSAPAPSSSAGRNNFPEPQIIEAPTPPSERLAPSKWQDTVSHTKPSDKEDVVRGFADNVPLSVALRQVLPQDLGFSVAQDVSLGTLVSWKGGAPWRQVAKDMLLPAGLAVKEQGNVVQIVHATESQIGSGSTASGQTFPSAPPARSGFGNSAPSDGKPMSLSPLSSSSPIRSVPDRNVPGGAGGVLAPPPSNFSPSSSLPSAMPAPYVMDKTVDAWTANRGDTLQKVLEDWSRRAHVELSWRAEYDFPLQASVSFTGSFEDAVRGLLMGFQEAKPQPIGFLYNNQLAGQTVLVVQTRGNNYNE